MTPPQVSEEIRRRGAAIAAIRSGASGWKAIDNMAAPVAAFATFCSLKIGLISSAIYAALRIGGKLLSNKPTRSSHQLEPSDAERSQYAQNSTKRLADINALLLGQSARFAKTPRHIGNSRHNSPRMLKQ